MYRFHYLEKHSRAIMSILKKAFEIALNMVIENVLDWENLIDLLLLFL